MHMAALKGHQNIIIHMLTTEERYICAICARGYKHRRNLVYHETALAGMLSFNCCGVGFSSRRQLQRHRCNVHSAREQRTREIECEICNPQGHNMGSSLRTSQNTQRGKKNTFAMCAKPPINI
ncbi:hypothetical protein DPMN_172307 [Dreissena polymorpha]|uniref:C2H2-type domain-containing protein n=1 Tax=Dreissena polymorpha TaxID=45954 RepID=A0A9D4IFY4_DREPO|nr:hypothetical protein DPMN_172307 [Dreissena polymorpha]